MENVGNREHSDFPATTLFYDDLMDIIETVLACSERVEFRTDKWKTDNTCEIAAIARKQANGRFDNITITSYSPHMQIQLYRHSIRVYVSEGSIEQCGVTAKIREIVDRGKKPYFETLRTLFIPILCIAGAIALMKTQYLLAVWLFLLPLLFISASVKYAMNNRVVIRTELRGDKKSFFQRKSDDITLALISAMIGGLITLLVSKYLL